MKSKAISSFERSCVVDPELRDAYDRRMEDETRRKAGLPPTQEEDIQAELKKLDADNAKWMDSFDELGSGGRKS